MTSEEIAAAAIDALEASGVPYMLVGAFSSNYYGIPRSTKDADFVLEFGTVSVQSIVQRLGSGFKLDPQVRFETATGTTRHIINVVGSPFIVEFFQLSADAHDQERFRRRCRVTLHDRPTYIPTAEDVIVTKLRWAVQGRRPKDSEDVRDVVAVQKDALDWNYIYRWCDQHGTREKLDEIRRSIPPL